LLLPIYLQVLYVFGSMTKNDKEQGFWGKLILLGKPGENQKRV